MTAKKKWNGWKKGELQIHFIHTGVAESLFYILPDGTTILQDCGDHPALTRLNLSVPVVPSPARLAGDWIARYIQRVFPTQNKHANGLPLIDYMILTHFHDDHCGSRNWQTMQKETTPLPGCCRSGFELAAERFAFGTAIDRGWPDYNDPIPTYCMNEFEHMQKLYSALQARDHIRIENMILGSTSQIGPKYSKIPDFQISNIFANGRIFCRNGKIKDLYQEHIQRGGNLSENAMSLGTRLRYGDFSFYSGGDFSAKVIGKDGKEEEIEDLLAPEIDPVDVAKVNHHGHHSMTKALVKALAPKVWISNVWDQLHLTEDVLLKLIDRTIYPGDRMIFPGVFPKERIEEGKDKAYLADIAPETFGIGCHSVITVPPGGKTFSVTCISAADENMTVSGRYEFKSAKE